MSWGSMALVQDVVDRISAAGNKEHLFRTLRALKLSQVGDALFADKDGVEAARKHEAALKELEGIPQAAALRAVITGALVSDYGIAGQPSKALTIGRRVLEELDGDPRLAIALGNCLHDMGAAAANLGRLKESISYVERALRSYETAADGADPAAKCMRTLDSLRQMLQEDNLDGPG